MGEYQTCQEDVCPNIDALSPSILSASIHIFAGFLESLLVGLPEELRETLYGQFFFVLPLSIVGAAGGLIYNVSGLIAARFEHFTKRYLQISLVFDNSDKHYDNLVDYIGSHCEVHTGESRVSTNPRKNPSFQDRMAKIFGGGIDKTPDLYYQPVIPPFQWKIKWLDEKNKLHTIWVRRDVNKPMMKMNKPGKAFSRDPETITLSMRWTMNDAVLKKFFKAALQVREHVDGDAMLDIYVKHEWIPIWEKACSKAARSKDTIVLDNALADYVIDDMRHFFSENNATWYKKTGIPYRRGYLLHGPPGCGKTTFAQVLAGELGLDICLVNLSSKNLNDDDLSELLRNAPPRAMILLEDVDAIFVERSAKDKNGTSSVSFSGLLNALDGTAAAEGCVVLMTTNYKDRLDPALIRPGRCDVHVHVQNATKDQARRMFLRFFALEALVESVDSSGVICSEAHGLESGECVQYRPYNPPVKLLASGERHWTMCTQPAPASVFYVNALNPDQFTLHERQEGSIAVTNIAINAKLQQVLNGAERFKTRVPHLQVSMAKVQSYMMKQKLLAELQLKNRLPDSLNARNLNPNCKLFKTLFNREVNRMAADSAVVNIHELLNTEADDRESEVNIYDHLCRVGVHQYAPLFEHFGIHDKSHISSDLKNKMGEWHLDFKVGGPQVDRLNKLMEGDSKELDRAYELADLSMLRDSFLEAYSGVPCPSNISIDRGAMIEIFQKLAINEDGKLSYNKFAAWLQGQGHTFLLDEEVKLNFDIFDKEGNNYIDQDRFIETCEANVTLLPSFRTQLPKQSSSTGIPVSFAGASSIDDVKVDTLMWHVEMAHKFQEILEKDGKSQVSKWSLDMHFARYENDPTSAIANAHLLVHNSTACRSEERCVKWLTASQFLARLGLERYLPKMEEEGYSLWHDFKHFSKDDWEEEISMSPEDAVLCDAVNTGSKERPDMLRKFQLPEFADLKRLFLLRFPSCEDIHVLGFARALTNELGSASVSLFQVESFLESTNSAAEAFSCAKVTPDLGSSQREMKAVEGAAQKKKEEEEEARKAEENQDWMQDLLRKIGKEEYYDKFVEQELISKDLVLKAITSPPVLEKIGITALGARIAIFEAINHQRVRESKEKLIRETEK